MVSGQPPEDEPRYEQIGRDLYDDGGPEDDDGGRGPDGGGPEDDDGGRGPDGGGPEDDDGGRGPDGGGPAPVRVPFRVAAAETARDAWVDAVAAFGRPSFWIVIVAVLAGAGATTYSILAWLVLIGWGPVPPLITYLLSGGTLSVAAAVLGAVWGFTRGRTTAPTVPPRLLACLLRGLVLGLLGVGLLLGIRVLQPVPASGVLSVDPASGLPEVPEGSMPPLPGLELLALLLVLFEAGVFAMIGMGFRACFAARLPGAVLTVFATSLFAVGNLATAFLLLPGTLAAEPVSVAVNVERDSAGRYVSYECIGGPVRNETILHSERVVWLTAGNPAVLYWTLASDLVPPDRDPGWFLVSLQRSMEGPAYDVPCINGVPSDELQSAFPLSVIGIAGQLGTAGLVSAGGVLAGRRRARA